MNEYNYNKDLISLTTEYITFPPREGCVSLDLMAEDPDDTDEKLLQDFQNIFYDLAAIFAKNHTVLYFAPYKKIKFESKNWLLGKWKPGKYAIKGETSKLKQYLIDAKWGQRVIY